MNLTNDTDNDNNYDLHPIEEVAHTLLSGSLDNLDDNFESLDQSQLILLTRLKVIEDRLLTFKKIAFEDGVINDDELTNYVNKIKDLQKRLSVTSKALSRIENRIDKMDGQLQIKD
ncbi:hypothetical protein DFJ63DRAFT_162199 [Scheffersomyces coipomensis]|uniref:uncharacterized protein n=1 Tax=Scheffersomyces coipomensis TaxID=1788519 RepID=UPI00315DE797